MYVSGVRGGGSAIGNLYPEPIFFELGPELYQPIKIRF